MKSYRLKLDAFTNGCTFSLEWYLNSDRVILWVYGHQAFTDLILHNIIVVPRLVPILREIV